MRSGRFSGPGETGFEHLFQWYSNGDVEVPTTYPDMTWRLTAPSAERQQAMMDMTGVLVVGRRLFDLTDGWGGNHPMGKPVVVTHRVPDGWPREDAPFHFASDGIESAIRTAQQIAGGKVVGVNGGTIARQCLNAGLLNEIWVDLAPVLLGGGTPFFDELSIASATLDGPLTVIEGKGVTHLRYRVVYS